MSANGATKAMLRDEIQRRDDMIIELRRGLAEANSEIDRLRSVIQDALEGNTWLLQSDVFPTEKEDDRE